MKKFMLISVALLAVCFVVAGCRSSSSSCFTRNGSRVPSQNYASAANTYPVEEVIYTSAPATACNPCAPNACQPACQANACDPCGTAGARYPSGTVMPGI